MAVDRRYSLLKHNHDDIYPRADQDETISGDWTITGDWVFSGKYNFTAPASANPLDAPIDIVGTNPGLAIKDTNASANSGNTLLFGTNDNFEIRAYNDAGNSFTTPLSIQRSGTTIDEIELNATNLDVNATTSNFSGNVDIEGALTVDNGNPGTGLEFTHFQIQRTFTAGNCIIDLNPVNDGSDNSAVRLFRTTNTSGQVQFLVLRGTNSANFIAVIEGNGSTSDGGFLFLKEASAANPDRTSAGQIWVRSSDGALMFTDSGGTDYVVDLTAV